MQPLVTDPSLLRRRLHAAFDAMCTLDGVDPRRTGAIGFCFGGLCALLMARMGLPLRGVASFHGQDDPMVPPEDIGVFAAEMQRVDADWQLHAYPKTLHAFTHPLANDPDFGTVYDEEADRRSWATMQAFFREVFA